MTISPLLSLMRWVYAYDTIVALSVSLCDLTSSGGLHVGTGSSALIVEDSVFQGNLGKQAAQLSFLGGGHVSFENITVLLGRGPSQVREAVGSCSDSRLPPVHVLTSYRDQVARHCHRFMCARASVCVRWTSLPVALCRRRSRSFSAPSARALSTSLAVRHVACTHY